MRRTLPASRALCLTSAVVVLAGCMNLDVTNSDTPANEDVFASGSNLEATVGLSFRNFWGVTQGARTNSTFPVVALGALAEILTGTASSTWEVIQEPRIVYDNYGAGQWVNRKPWYDLYEVIATETDALKSLDKGVKVGVVNATTPNGADTPRARAFARFLIGASQVYLGVIFDKAFITDEKTDLSFLAEGATAPGEFPIPFSPYKDVSAAGIAQLEKAIAEARSAPTNFTLPLEWVNQQTVNRDELVRVMNGYIVRALVYTPRTPTERQAVDWNRVLTLTAAPNVITRDFGQLADATKSGTTSAFLQYSQLMTDARIDNHLVGPADTSGTYQRWLATPVEQRNEIIVQTPDRRIHGAGGPTTAGKYFNQPGTQTMSQVRGTQVNSRYRGVRYGTNYYQTGFIPTMTLVEMDLTRAEALIRLGRAAEAVPLINKTRVANGELPPVTVSGTGTKPTCVPRKANGDCGDLLDALLYEKRIELHAIEAILHWADWRAFGKLPKGSLMQLPVHGRELQTLGLPIYTFGGDQPGSAP